MSWRWAEQWSPGVKGAPNALVSHREPKKGPTHNPQRVGIDKNPKSEDPETPWMGHSLKCYMPYCICTHTYAELPNFGFIYIYIYKYTHMYIYIYVYVCICMYMDTDMDMYKDYVYSSVCLYPLLCDGTLCLCVFRGHALTAFLLGPGHDWILVQAVQWASPYGEGDPSGSKCDGVRSQKP